MPAMGMQPPAPPPGASDDPGWRREHSPYGAPPPGSGPPPGYRAYGPPPAGQFGAAIEHPQGTTILVLGILGLVVCQVIGPIAWAMGARAQKEIDLDPARYTNRGNVVAGKILGIVATVLLVVSVVVWIAIIGLIIGAAND
jgi:hypothetical protein